MSKLSPELQKLVSAGRHVDSPTDADSARVLCALRARLGEAAIGGADWAGPPSSKLLFGKASAIGFVGLALLGASWFVMTREPSSPLGDSNAVPRVSESPAISLDTSPDTLRLIATVSSSGEQSGIAVGEGQPSESQPSESQSSESQPRAEVRAGVAVRTRDTLSEEVALLSRAEKALNAGKPAAALQVLNEHERRFGRGLLTEERTAARAQALCALGRGADAEAQLAQLSSKSLHGARTVQACSSVSIK